MSGAARSPRAPARGVVTPLGDSEVAALREALEDEYKAIATYDQVIADFGPVRPFVNIREAERRHAAALIRLFRHFGVRVPPNAWAGRVERYASLAEACRAGVDGEIANAALYERLIAAARHDELRVVFQRLRNASRLRHLPAFRRCLARQSARVAHAGNGSGAPRRRRRRCVGEG